MYQINTLPMPQEVPPFMKKYYGGIITPAYVKSLIDWAEKELFDTKMYFISIYHKRGFDRLHSKTFSFINFIAGSKAMDIILKYITPRDWRRLPLVYRRVLQSAYDLHRQMKLRRQACV